MSNINTINMFGNLTRDPEIRHANSGLAIVNGALAVNRWRKDKEDYVSYFDFKLFGKTAEAFERNHSKGDKVLLTGYLEQERWEDKSTGAARSKVVLVVESFEFVKGDKPAKAKSNF